MFKKLSLSSFFSNNVKVYVSLAFLFLMAWFFSFKPAIYQYRNAQTQELNVENLMLSERESELYSDSYPFVTSRKVLSNRDEILLRTLDQNQYRLGYKITSIDPFIFLSRAGISTITTKVTLEGSYIPFVMILDSIMQKPEIGKVSSVKIYTVEDRITKKKKLFNDIIIQIIAEQ